MKITAKKLKILFTISDILLLLVLPYVAYYRELKPKVMAANISLLELHGYIILYLALPTLVYLIYPQALGLFNVKDSNGLLENIKRKKHLIIMGILATAILHFFAVGGTAKGSLISAIGGTISLLIGSTVSFGIMYMIGALFSKIFHLMFAIRNMKNKWKAEQEKMNQEPNQFSQHSDAEDTQVNKN